MSDVAGPGPLEVLFSPSRIAVVGASDVPDKAGYAMMESLSVFGGDVFPINPRSAQVWGRRAYPTVADTRLPADLAVLVIPATAVPTALEQCAAAGVRAAVICSGGFAESGPSGAELEERVREIAGQTGLRILGPNTSGFINPLDRVTANFMPAVRELRPGSISVVAQSGGVNLALAFLLDAAGAGVRLAAGLGNAVDVGFVDVLDHLCADPATTAIGVHVEGVADGRAFVEAIRRASAHKPVVALKVGRNDVGDFARSHTGAVTGSYRIARSALQQAGAVVVDSPGELVDALLALSRVRLSPQGGTGVGVITGQAGPGLIIADELASYGVQLPTLTADTTTALSGLLPPLTYQQNPVDTGRPGQTFPEVLSAVGQDPSVDLLAVYALDEPGALDPAHALDGLPVPALFASGGPGATMRERGAAVGEIGVPFFDSPDRLVRGVAAVLADQRAQRTVGADRLDSTYDRPRLGASPDEDQAKSLLEQLGLPVPTRRVAASRVEAHGLLGRLRAPLVVKVLDAAITHKSDVGGVHVGVRTPTELDAALDAIEAIAPDRRVRFLLEEQAPAGSELIVGAIRDPAFGPAVVVGIGGVDVELGPPPVIRLAPISPGQARYAVDELPASFLEGHRGAPPIDRDGLARILSAVSELIACTPDLREVDLNPVRMTEHGLVILDALLITE